MRRATLRTIPVSYSETLQPSRAADCTAIKTGLGSQSFVDFNIHRLPSGRFVPQHMTEGGPASIQYGLCHPRLGKLAGAHIADDDQGVLPSNLGGLFVKMVTPRVRDLGVDSADTDFVSGTLGLRQRCLIFAVVAERRNLRPVATRCQRLETEIDTDFAVASGQIIDDPALEGDVPASARILNESASPVLPFDIARLPEAKPTLKINRSVTIDLHRTRNERNPTKGALGSKAGAEARALALRVARYHELPTNGLYSIGMQAQVCGTSGAKFDQIEGRWPPYRTPRQSTTLSLSLRRNAEVPHLISRNGVPIKVLPDRRVLDAEFECENAHSGSQAGFVSLDQERVVGCLPGGAFAFCISTPRQQQGVAN